MKDLKTVSGKSVWDVFNGYDVWPEWVNGKDGKIINKNNEEVKLDKVRYNELDINGNEFRDIQTNKKYIWGETLEIAQNSILILSNN